MTHCRSLPPQFQVFVSWLAIRGEGSKPTACHSDAHTWAQSTPDLRGALQDCRPTNPTPSFSPVTKHAEGHSQALQTLRLRRGWEQTLYKMQKGKKSFPSEERKAAY